MMTSKVNNVLYSFRRCPYAIRARLALAACQIKCELREIKLSAKPAQLLKLSPKGTVPVLYIQDANKVLDESLDIMLWALKQNPSQNWLPKERIKQDEIWALIERNDYQFKPWLDKYKYPDRFPEQSADYYFEQASIHLKPLQLLLQSANCLGGKQYNLTDMAILPFVRQFAAVDRQKFDQNFPILTHWLDGFLASDLFKTVMVKYACWQDSQQKVYFPS